MFTTRILAIVTLLFGGLTFAQSNLAKAQATENLINTPPEPQKLISIDEMMGVAPGPGDSGYGVGLALPSQQVEGGAARLDADPKRPDADPNTPEVGTVVDGLGEGKKSGYRFGLFVVPSVVPTDGSKGGMDWTMPPLPNKSGSTRAFFSDPNAGRTSSNPNAGRTSR